MRRSIWKLFLMLIVLALPLGLGLSLSQEAEAPEGEEPPEVEKPLVIPDHAKQRKNPYPGNQRSIENGKQIYQTQCTMCHGVTGDGKGDLVERLGLKVPDFTDPAMQKKRTDGELFFILTNGHKDMPGEGARFSEDWRWDLVNYIRSLGK
jgi:mono/diheme cytochrome c family protein